MPIDHVNALPSGTRFEEYRLDAVLGAGGFGITYRAYDANLDKFVAIKEYLPSEFATRAERYTVVPQSSTDAQDYHWGLTRFLDEARTLARFDHPHLNKVYRFFESNGTAYMVLEYVEGETLADRLTRERQLPEESLRRLLEEVLSGLEVMHAAGYVHRDIKPGNLMLREEDGSAVVLDFGAARQAVGQRSKAITSILTPGYAPIEQYDSKADDVGPWSDIYALGMVAYRCISGIGDGELPDAVTRGRTQRKGQVDLIPAVEAGKGKYSAKHLEAIDWAIEVDEQDRPQSVDVWRGALAGSGRRKGPTKSVRKSVAKPTSSRPTERAGLSWHRALLMMVLGALVAAGAWWGWQAYPQWFGQSTGDAPAVAEQTAQVERLEEAPQDVETGKIETSLPSAEDTPPPDKAEAEQPISKEPALSPEEAEVTRLLAAAEADLEARRLTSPAGNNAWDRYQQVLEIDPANPDAIKGMERVIESYMELFAAAVEQVDFDQAESYLERIRDLHPDSPSLLAGKKQLEEAKQARADRLAEQEHQRQAEEATRQAELERQWIANAIEEHMTAFEAAMQAQDLNEAAGILVQIRDLNPEAPGLAQGEERLAELERQLIEQVVEEHWVAFEAALEAEDLDESDDILNMIRDLDPGNAGLAESEQRLAEVQQTALEREYAGEMVSIPGGTFRMGDLSGGGDDDELPVHSVTVPAFRMGKYEVTFTQWDACVVDGGCGGYRPDDEGWGRGNRPVINVSWDDAQVFIGWLNDKTGGKFRLPTEAEWEYAARAGSTTKYHFGNSESQLCRYANHADDSTDYSDRNKFCSDGVGRRTAEVGRYQPNSFGLYDMHGNVREWVQDCYNDSYVGAPSDGKDWTGGDCNERVYRSGSWSGPPKLQTSSHRYKNTRPTRHNNHGFRLVQNK